MYIQWCIVPAWCTVVVARSFATVHLTMTLASIQSTPLLANHFDIATAADHKLTTEQPPRTITKF